MKIAAIKSNDLSDSRSTLHPETLDKLTALEGVSVSFEMDLCQGMSINDQDLRDLGLECLSREDCIKNADLLIVQSGITEDEINLMKPGSTVIGMISPFANKDMLVKLASANVNVVSMEFIPRITRAQKMDVLSSQANLAGYVAVIEAAKHLKMALPMMMTAAGTVTPAKYFILGAGVAGLQAIATAKRLGAVVSATDVRLASKEQVESLGGKFLTVEGSENLETEGGYAKEATEDFKKKQEDLLKETLKKIDIVICTALIPGKPSPKIITKKMVDGMKIGSVIMDLASEFGGNCELTKHGETVDYKSKKIVGPLNLPASVAQDSSRLFSKNVLNFLMNSCNDGKFKNFNWEDEVVKETCIIDNLKKKEK